MLAKGKFLEKTSIIIIFIVVLWSKFLLADDIKFQVLNYNNNLKNSSALFIQNDGDSLEEGEIYFGNDRIKINYIKPQKITLILSEKKGMYTNHDLKETEFFLTKKSYVKIFFDIFHKKKHLKEMIIEQLSDQIIISEKIKVDNITYDIKLIYENEPIKLRRLEITSDNDKIQMGFFNHSLESSFDKNFFSMIDPYLN